MKNVSKRISASFKMAEANTVFSEKKDQNNRKHIERTI